MTVAPFFWTWLDLRIQMVPNRFRRGSCSHLDADKILCAVTAQLGWSDPTNYFGHGYVHKSGVAPAQSGVLSAPKLIVMPCATSSVSDSSENPKVNAKGDGRGDLCLSCTVHPRKKNPGGCLERMHENGMLLALTISGACCEVAKHTPFLLPEVGPRNAATEEELRNAREKMCPNLMPKDGPRAARISEWEKSGEDSSFISIG